MSVFGLVPKPDMTMSSAVNRTSLILFVDEGDTTMRLELGPALVAAVAD
jgi:hypothetical protein